MKAIYALIFISLLIISGCANSIPDNVDNQQVEKKVVYESDVDNEPVVQNIDQDIKDLEDLENELQDPGLDDIDKELADINW